MEFHELLEVWNGKRENAVLATVIGVAGHAYRKEGATMLLYAGGLRVGAISPGCLEADLAERVTEVLAAGAMRTVEYDMRDAEDWAWGETVGCGGKITVLMEPVDGRLADVLAELLLCLERGEACCLVRQWGAGAVRSAGPYALGAAEAREGAGMPRLAEMPEGLEVQRDQGAPGQPGPFGGRVDYRVEAAVPPRAATGWEGLRFRLLCEPRPRLIIFGAGADAGPLAALAAAAGFRVVVADWREQLCCSDRFAGCGTFVGSPKEAVERLGVGSPDYVVIMSHHPGRDRQCLEALWPLAPRYVGVLGSKTRTGRLLEGRVPPPWLRWPVGLAIGAVGPQEIAVSVVAQLIAVRRCAEGSERGGSVCLDTPQEMEHFVERYVRPGG